MYLEPFYDININLNFGIKTRTSIIKYLFADKYLGGTITGVSVLDEILEFDPLTGQWQEMAKMIQARAGHAVSVITFESGLCV